MATNKDMNARLERVETKMDRLEAKVDGLERKVDGLENKVDGLENKVDGLEKKVDQLPTKADLSGFATKADLSGFATKADLAGLRADLAGFATKADLAVFADEIKNQMGIMLGDAKESVQKAAEGYGATLGRIERDLSEFRTEWKNKTEDTDRVLGNHVVRIVALERVTGLSHD